MVLATVERSTVRVRVAGNFMPLATRPFPPGLLNPCDEFKASLGRAGKSEKKTSVCVCLLLVMNHREGSTTTTPPSLVEGSATTTPPSLVEGSATTTPPSLVEGSATGVLVEGQAAQAEESDIQKKLNSEFTSPILPCSKEWLPLPAARFSP